jgi:hypothetical protein
LPGSIGSGASWLYQGAQGSDFLTVDGAMRRAQPALGDDAGARLRLACGIVPYELLGQLDHEIGVAAGRRGMQVELDRPGDFDVCVERG